MNTTQKRSPAFTDMDSMPFGKFKGLPLQDVPASYLSWLKDEMQSTGQEDISKFPERYPNTDQTKLKLYNYIFNSWDAIKMELKEKE